MTWVKFQSAVLPTADEIEILIHHWNNSYAALVTAANPDAPPILQWDAEGHRNPVSWYQYARGSMPKDWRLTPDSWAKVTAVAYKPSMWADPDKFSHQGLGVMFILDGAKETREDCGAALFPECMRSEFHGIRATIEAYSNAAKIEGREEGSACGLLLQNGSAWKCHLRVKSKGQVFEYILDRWD